MTKVHAGKISYQAREMLRALAQKHGWTFADAVDHVCAFYNDKMWHEAGIVARRRAEVDKLADGLIDRVEPEHD